MPHTTTRTLALALLLPASAALAQPHAGDILLSVSPTDSRITIGLVDPATGTPQPGSTRVFGANLALVGGVWATNNPGFDTLPNTFAPGSATGFRLRAPLARWDGTRFITSTPSTPVPRLAVTLSFFPPLGPVFTPDPVPGESPEPVTGFTVGVLSEGRWHWHLEYTLRPGTAGEPVTPGIYLLEMSMFNTNPSVGDSRPLWLVFNHSSPAAEHAAAIEHARYVLAREGCPADMDRDRAVTTADITAFLSAWFTARANPTPDTIDLADTDRDGAVTTADITAFLSLWFAARAGGC